MQKLISFLFLFFLVNPAWGIEIYLKNGDKITGILSQDDERHIIITTTAAGDIKIDKAFIDMQKSYPEEYSLNKTKVSSKDDQNKIEWEKTASLGYTQSSGNTNKSQGIGSFKLNRKTKFNESTAKLDVLNSNSNKKIDARKFYGMLRYANSFGKNLSWYNFYKIEGQQDRLANIDYRLIPSIGRGYWFSDNQDLRAMTELGIGYQYTNYRIELKSKKEAVVVPRLFIDKRLINELHLSEDFTLYPSITHAGQLRYHSETSLINPINDRWALSIRFINDFDSKPAASIKKSDYTWITSLDYKF